MAGYSGTPLPKKLGIKEGHKVALFGAPDGFELDAPGAAFARDPARGPADVMVFFVTTRAQLEKRFAPLAKRLDKAGGLWVAWPKKASKVPTDVTEDVVREVALATGLVDNKVCAIDDTWSGLRLCYRLQDRERGTRP